MTVKKRRAGRGAQRAPAILPRELDLFFEDWLALTPRERLARSWALRARLRDPQAVHDAKLFPKPEDETLPQRSHKRMKHGR
jgi:hypothetical protein